MDTFHAVILSKNLNIRVLTRDDASALRVDSSRQKCQISKSKQDESSQRVSIKPLKCYSQTSSV